MSVLSQADPSHFADIASAIKVGGPIVAFLIVGTFALVYLYRNIYAPQADASRQAAEKRDIAMAEIAKGFAATSGALKETMEAAERITEHSRITVEHLRDVKMINREPSIR